MEMFRLKLRSGNHVERYKKGELVTYKAGSVVSSDRDLVALFPDKFELISGRDLGKVATTPNIPKLSKKKKSDLEDKDVIRNKDGTVYKDMEDPGFGVKTSEESKYGIDVTEGFPTALKVGLNVFEKSRWFTVVDPENDEVLNEKKLRKDKVEGFLKDYLHDEEEKEDEDDDDEEDDDEEE